MQLQRSREARVVQPSHLFITCVIMCRIEISTVSCLRLRSIKIRIGITRQSGLNSDVGLLSRSGGSGFQLQAAAIRSSVPSHSCPLMRRSGTLLFDLYGSFGVKRNSTPAFWAAWFHYQVSKVTAKFEHEAHFSSGIVSRELLLLICSAANSVCQRRCLAWRPSPHALRESQIPAVKAQEAVTSFEGYESSCYLPLPGGGGWGWGSLQACQRRAKRRPFAQTRQPPRADADTKPNKKKISETVRSSSLAGPS